MEEQIGNNIESLDDKKERILLEVEVFNKEWKEGKIEKNRESWEEALQVLGVYIEADNKGCYEWIRANSQKFDKYFRRIDLHTEEKILVKDSKNEDFKIVTTKSLHKAFTMAIMPEDEVEIPEYINENGNKIENPFLKWLESMNHI